MFRPSLVRSCQVARYWDVDKGPMQQHTSKWISSFWQPQIHSQNKRTKYTRRRCWPYFHIFSVNIGLPSLRTKGFVKNVCKMLLASTNVKKFCLVLHKTCSHQSWSLPLHISFCIACSCRILLRVIELI